MNPISYGVIIARCQVHELHEGHLALMREVRARHNRVLVLLGEKPIGATPKNPLNFEIRKLMLRETFPEFTALPLMDMADDERWSQEVDAQIETATRVSPGEVVLYGSRDSFIPHYKGKYDTQELFDLPTVADPTFSGTHIREKLTKTIMSSADFRAGVIYAVTNMHPQCKATVDVILTHFSNSEETGVAGDPVFLLLGRKHKEPKFRFIGGFSEPMTPSYEFDAAREVSEETGIKVDITSSDYIGSMLVPDWRWAGEPDQIKTLVFVGKVDDMNQGVGGDDIAEVKWVKTTELSAADLMPVHHPLFAFVKNHFETKYQVKFKE